MDTSLQNQDKNSFSSLNMDAIGDLSALSPGFIGELDFDAYMGPVGDGCYAPQTTDGRRPGSHQLPESPPDSGSENPYSPSETQLPQTISVPQTVLNTDYMLVPEHIPNEILTQNGDYIYEELKSDEVLRNNLNDVVVLNQDPTIVELGIRTPKGYDDPTHPNLDMGIRNVRHDIIDMYQSRYVAEIDQGMINPQLALGHEIAPVYTSLQEPSAKKRKQSQDSSQVKCEPAALSPESGGRGAPPSEGSEAGDEAPLQCIRFATFQQPAWHALFDSNLKPLQTPSYVVGADKGFNYSQIDEAFVCQKKNHFQVTCQMQMQGDPHYVKTSEGFKKINNFCLHFYGVKAEDPSQEVRVEQSQSDRTKKPFHPVPVEIRREGAKVTVGRLHFAETTNNNMRKKGRPNPDQRHFQLVVALRAHAAHATYIVAAHASDRIIVRASNPGQFESDCPEGWWQRGVSENSVHFSGRVGINTDRPDESCVVNGNLKVMGHILHPSDARAKHNIEELDTAQQLKNVQSIRVVNFDYEPSFAAHSGLVGYDPARGSVARDTGVIAQELRSVLPDAVREAGHVALPNGDTIHKFLVVNKDRIFMENLGAVKELCKVTGNLESRIDQLERMNKKLCNGGLQRRDSSRSSVSNDSRYSATSMSSKSLYSDNVSIDQIRDIARNIRKHECCHKLSHNSPKYTRKQCKNCHSYSKYGKYYNANKTSLPKKEKKVEPPFLNEKIEEKKDTCLWMRDDFSYSNSKLGFCCRKEYSNASSELISNKLLQIIITILIFIMAVCLVVMSALYFREHQELVSMKAVRRHDKFSYPTYGKINAPHRAPIALDLNQIQNSKTAQHATAKKTAKEKGPHKTTQEYPTTISTELPHLGSTIHSIKTYPTHLNSVPTLSPLAAGGAARVADVIGHKCTLALNTNNELDPECQSSCGLEQPQTYDNQEPIERRQDKDKLPSIPIEKNNNNNSETNDFKINEDIGETNFLDLNKQNETENVSRVRRYVRETENGSRVRRDVRETEDGSSEEMMHEQSRELGIYECDQVRFGVASKSSTNSSLFTENVCAHSVYNFTYTIPLSHCLNHKNIDITFKTTKLKEFRICHTQCARDDSSINCQRIDSKPIPSLDTYTFKMPLDCKIDRYMKIRAVFLAKDPCNIPESKIPFVEYNIRFYRHCHN